MSYALIYFTRLAACEQMLMQYFSVQYLEYHPVSCSYNSK